MKPPINPISQMLDNLRVPTHVDRIEYYDTFVDRSARFSTQAVTEAANRFLDGDVGNGKFAPTVAEFLAECASRQELIDIRNKPEREPRPVNTGPCPFEVNQERLRHENRNRPVLFENVSHDQFLKLAKSKQLPVGSHWQAALGTVFGPEQELS